MASYFKTTITVHARVITLVGMRYIEKVIAIPLPSLDVVNFKLHF